ncbi:MAG: hypothetical protein JST54_28280 [Deltaproteobacteria bacterium]|nr:hypothetical protein [Deltaproteobacteria bacterium]
MTRRVLLAAALALAGLAALLNQRDALADGASCTTPQVVDNYQLLRRLSLDLRGTPPTMSEYAQVTSGTDPLALAGQWTSHWNPEQAAPDASHEAFRQQMRKYHSALLWPNVSNVKITNTFAQVKMQGSDYDGGVGWLTGRTKAYYQANPEWAIKPDVSNSNTLPVCDPTRPQPANGYSSDGLFRPIPQNDTYPDGGAYQWVGYRVVQPYWKTDGGTTELCAYEAQETLNAGYYKLGDGGYIPFLTSPDGGGVSVACDSQASSNAAYCGCGPHANFCFGGTVTTDVENDMVEQMMKVIDLSTVGGSPYTDVIQTPTSYVNGHLAFYKQYLPDMNTTLSVTYTENDPAEHMVDAGALNSSEVGALPILGYNDPKWYRVTRSPQHAGVLTLPGYLLRFQTNRGRANRFRIDFLCNYFIPPSQLNDAPPACSATTSDLMRKCNCRLCHATLEPLAAHWGQFSEAGFSLLQGDAGFPEDDPTCNPYPDGGQKTKDARCTRYYVVDNSFDVPAGEVDSNPHTYGGSLKTYLYSDIHNDVIAQNIMAGKDDLRAAYIDNANHDFAHCTVQKVFSYFIRRDMRLVGADNDEAKLLEDLAADFATDYDFSRLVMKIVSLPQYRRIH